VTLASGTTFGPYQILEPLGRGGMATVYKAYEPGLDRYVALKILPREFLHDEGFAERFRREAKVIARLEHPNIIPIHNFGIEEQSRTPWMAMRLISGGALAGIMKKSRLGAERTTEILRGVAQALDYAHGKGVVHRDIKPQNILLDEAERVYLADFGIAKMVEGSSGLTATGMISGTPQYMAPEQAMAGTVDNRADIYALGIVAYEMLTGRVPFAADTPVAVLMKHVQEPIPIPSPRDVPEPLMRALLKALAKRPEDRWPTAVAFVKALAEGLGQASTVSAMPASAPTAFLPVEPAPAPRGAGTAGRGTAVPTPGRGTAAGAPAAGTPHPGTPQPRTPYPGTPYPGTPQTGTPYPGTPYPGTPRAGTPGGGTPYPQAVGAPYPGTPPAGTSYPPPPPYPTGGYPTVPPYPPGPPPYPTGGYHPVYPTSPGRPAAGGGHGRGLVLGLVAAVVLAGILGTAALLVLLRPGATGPPERPPVTLRSPATADGNVTTSPLPPPETLAAAPTTTMAAPPTRPSATLTPPVRRSAAPTPTPAQVAEAAAGPPTTLPPPTTMPAVAEPARPHVAPVAFPGAGKVDVGEKFFEKTFAYDVGQPLSFEGRVGPITVPNVQLSVGDKKGRFGKVDDLRTEVRAVAPILNCPKGAGEWDYKLVVELLDENGRRLDRFDGGGSCENEIKSVAATRGVLKALLPAIRGVKIRLEAAKD
jgi:serine/threonine-protein kinase